MLTAVNGQEAVEIFRERADEIACVLLDLTMPKMDGEQAYREIRALKPEACVIVSSGYSEVEMSRRFQGKGVSGFIQKPYRLATLSTQLRLALAADGDSEAGEPR